MVRISGVADGVPPVRAMPRATASALFLEVPVGEKTTGRIDFGCMSRVFVQDKGTEKTLRRMSLRWIPLRGVPK